MKITTCDICNAKIDDYVIRIEMGDGEHPHNGTLMYKTVDCCAECASALELECKQEYSDVLKIIDHYKKIKRDMR
jgi:hypothetical protein